MSIKFNRDLGAIRRAITAFENATREHENVGSQRLEDQEAITESYLRARANLEKLIISKLEQK